MCKAVQDMITEAKVSTLADLVKDHTLTVEKAAEKAGMTVEQFKKIMGKDLL